jgi:hypothetical protein
MSLNVLVATPFGSNPDSAGTASGDARAHSVDGPEAWLARIAIVRQSGYPEDLQVLRDGAGGTADMVKEVTRRTGQVTWLDTRELW